MAFVISRIHTSVIHISFLISFGETSRKVHNFYSFSPLKGFEKSSFPWQDVLNNVFSILNFVLHYNTVLTATLNMPDPAVFIPKNVLLESLVGTNFRYIFGSINSHSSSNNEFKWQIWNTSDNIKAIDLLGHEHKPS